jgi:hypothetical protein
MSASLWIRRGREYFGDFLLQLLDGQVANEKSFLPRRFAADELNLRPPHAKRSCEHVRDGLICLTFFGGLDDADLERTTMLAADAVRSTAGLRVNGDHGAIVM